MSMPGYFPPINPHSSPAWITCVPGFSVKDLAIDRLARCKQRRRRIRPPAGIRPGLFGERSGQGKQADDLVGEFCLRTIDQRAHHEIAHAAVRREINDPEVVRGFHHARHLHTHAPDTLWCGMQQKPSRRPDRSHASPGSTTHGTIDRLTAASTPANSAEKILCQSARECIQSVHCIGRQYQFGKSFARQSISCRPTAQCR